MRVTEAWPALCILLAVLLLTSLPSVHAKRALRQSDAFSNSNGCLDSIPKCEPGACATRNIMGTASWVCLRCKGNYEPVVDSSGQDNIVQCGKWSLHSDVLQLRSAACVPVCHTAADAGQLLWSWAQVAVERQAQPYVQQLPTLAPSVSYSDIA
jgi:hypothetical protein